LRILGKVARGCRLGSRRCNHLYIVGGSGLSSGSFNFPLPFAPQRVLLLQPLFVHINPSVFKINAPQEALNITRSKKKVKKVE
jgi:hypothetical protein